MCCGTAGAGVILSEMRVREFARNGGYLHEFQLWVNLPKRDKMTKPWARLTLK